MDYTKEYGHPEGWSDEEKQEIIRLFKTAPVFKDVPDERILKIAAEHWKFQNGKEIEGDVTLEELEEKLRQNRKTPRRPASPKPKL